MSDAGPSKPEGTGAGSATSTEALSRLAIDWLPTALLVVRADGSIVVVNRRLEQQFGYTRDELVGQSIDMLLSDAQHPGQAVRAAGLVMKGATQATSAARHSLGRRRDGSRFPVKVSVNPIETREGTLLLAAVVDAGQGETQNTSSRSIEEQMEFESLVAELFVQFINLPADAVDGAMRDALRRIGEGLDLDRCNFVRIQPDGLAIDPVSWVRAGFPPAPAPIATATSFPWVLETIRAGKVVCFSSLDEIPNPIDRENYRSFGLRSALTVPLSVGGQLLGAVGFNCLREPRVWHPGTVHRLRMIAVAFGNLLARQKGDEALQAALAEVQRLRDELQAENVYLRREVDDRRGTGTIVGQSAAIRGVLALVEQVAATDSTVLLLGETGTGKELFASQIHELSARRDRPMVRVHCAAIPATLIESELFGREKGAFTDALTRQIGRFELADHSTIFLDEIGDLPLEVQIKLLRVLEERQIERLGSPRTIRVNTRIIAATHRNLEERIAAGEFREDLFYRLNVFPIQVPPLRERVEDIPALVWRFVDEFSNAFGKRIGTISRENFVAFQQYAWPGNIRELRNAVERAMIVATSAELTIAVPSAPVPVGKASIKLADVERDHIRSVLQTTGWRIRGAGGAADRLGMRPTTLETRMAKLGLARPKGIRERTDNR